MDQYHHILKLPVEVRLNIYDYLLTSNCPITVHTMAATPKQPILWDSLFRPHINYDCNCIRETCRPYIAILLTCKTINHEATAVLYSENRFTISNGPYSPISPKNSAYMRQALHMMATEWLMRFRPSTLAMLKPVMEECRDRQNGGPATIQELVVTSIDVQKLISIIEDDWNGSLESIPNYSYPYYFSMGMRKLLDRPYDGTEATHKAEIDAQTSLVRWKGM